MKRTRIFPMRFFVLFLACVMPGIVSADAQQISASAVRYDPAADRLTLHVGNVSLVWALGEISRQSGLEVRVDPGIERQVSQEFRELPLDAAVGRLVSGLNVIKAYGEDRGGRENLKAGHKGKLLVRIVVLPAGSSDASRAVPAFDPGKERGFRAAMSVRASRERGAAMDVVEARWQSRLAKMPAIERKKYEEARAAQEKKYGEHEDARQAREMERAGRKAQADARRQQDEDARLAGRGGGAPAPALDPAMAEQARQQFPQPRAPAVRPDRGN